MTCSLCFGFVTLLTYAIMDMFCVCYVSDLRALFCVCYDSDLGPVVQRLI